MLPVSGENPVTHLETLDSVHCHHSLKNRGPCGPLNDVETRRVSMVKGTLFISLDLLIGPILNVCWKVAPVFLVTCLLLRISLDGAIQYSVTANT